MLRRSFNVGLAASFVASCPLRASAEVKFRIGFLGLAPASGWIGPVNAFRSSLRRLGYEEGRNITIDFRWAATPADLRQAADDLVAERVAIIVAPASTEVEPASQATRTIPIIFAQHADPVGLGHVDSLARPGRNMTGVSMLLTELATKALDLIVEALPSAKRFGVIWNPTTPSHPRVLAALARRAGAAGIELLPVPVQTVDDFTKIFAILVEGRVDGFVVPTSPLTNANPIPLANEANARRLPGMFGNRENAVAGGLMSYGADFNDMYGLAAEYVGKILKGANVAELPVQQASKYNLVLNMKTAKSIGVTLPQTIVARADEIIE